jgi:uncharacterized membrane protein
MGSLVSVLLRGTAAGAAGTVALTIATSVRGRPERERRIPALVMLTGAATGIGIGGLAGVLRAAGVRLPTALGGPLLGLATMAASADRAADVVPYLVYGCTTHATLVAISRVAEGHEPVPPARPAALLRAAALGAASGARSASGIAAVALTSRADDTGPVASRLGTRAGTVLTSLAAAGELLVDKLPEAPSRLTPVGLVPRTALGAASAAAVARRDGHESTLPGLIGAASAIATATLGVRWRAASARRFGSDRPGALAEDVLAALLGWLGARRPGQAGVPETTLRPLRR